MNKLNDRAIKSIKPTGKIQRLYDGNYLYLFISPKGKKVFRVKGYRLPTGKHINEITIGEYYDGKKGHITLAQAREQARQIIIDYKNGIDVHKQLKRQKAKDKFAQHNTLNDWVEIWIDSKKGLVTDDTLRGYRGKYNKWIAPRIGTKAITDIDEDDMEALYIIIQDKGSSEIIKRCHIILNGIFKLAIKKRVVKNNPTQLAKDEIKPVQDTHFPAITNDNDIGHLLVTMDNYDKGMISTQYAFKLIPYLMLRPANVVSLKWSDIDFDKRLIRIDAERMKTGQNHAVPYPTQVQAILEELHEITGDNEFVLPNRKGNGHLHRDALSKAMRDSGFQGKHTPHGYRAMATTWLYDNQYYDYAIEKQLSHIEGNKVKRAYSRDDTMRFIDDRRAMLQDFADYLDALKDEYKNQQ